MESPSHRSSWDTSTPGYLLTPSDISLFMYSFFLAKLVHFALIILNVSAAVLWKKIADDATAADEIGSSLGLSCMNHGKIATVSQPSDFKIKSPAGMDTILDIIYS